MDDRQASPHTGRDRKQGSVILPYTLNINNLKTFTTMENQVTVMKSEELQLMEARANAEFAVTAAGQLMKSFETTQRIGTMFSKSSIVPKEYQGNVANCAIAVDMAMHLGKGISPLTVMQQLTIVQGRPTWSAQFLIS